MDRTGAATTNSSTSSTDGRRGLVLSGLMLTTGLSAMDSSIVATAVPTIVASLGGFTRFPWVFSAYLLAMAVTIPLYGKLADHWGRKLLLLIGCTIFLIGSAAAGFAWNMTALIAFRALQGVGAGALRPLTVTIAGDIYTVEERARIQGLLSSVWGISAVLGPLFGGLFTQFVSWRWIFFVNLPIGVAAMAMIFLHFHEHVVHRKVRTDYAGAGLLVVGMGAIVFTLLEAGSSWQWSDLRTVIVGVSGILIMLLFGLRERRAANPVFPLWMFGNRALGGAVLATLTVGLMTLGVSAYVPTFAQTVYGSAPIVAGAILGLMSISWPLAATYSGRLYLRIGYRNTALLGGAVVIAAAALFSEVGQSGSVLLLGAGTVVMGAGLGLITTPMIVGAQSIVDWGRRGVVTGAVTFGQMLGGTLSTAIFGSVFNSALASWFRRAPQSIRSQLPRPDHAADLLQGGATGPVADFVRTALYNAVHHVFLGLVAVGILGFVVVLIAPRHFAYIGESPESDNAPQRQGRSEESTSSP